MLQILHHWYHEHLNTLLTAALVLLPSIANGLREHKAGRSGLAGFIDSALDRLSLVTPKNLAGTFKLPGTRSR